MSDRFRDKYPNTWAALVFVGKAALIGVALGIFGRWQYERGFHRGVTVSACAVNFIIDHPGASTDAVNDACTGGH